MPRDTLHFMASYKYFKKQIKRNKDGKRNEASNR